MIRPSRRRLHRRGLDHRLRLELLESRQLLAADLLSPAVDSTLLESGVGDPFAADAVTVDQVVARSKTDRYVAGELLIALQIAAIDTDAQTTQPPRWFDHLDQPLVQPAKTIISFETSATTSFSLIHVQLGSDANLISEMRRLDRSSDVLWSQPNFIYHGTDPRDYVPNDPQVNSQYHHQLIDNFTAWDVTFGSSEIIIGITDDGVDLDHEDLVETIWTNPGEIPGDGEDNDGNGYVDDVNGYNFLNDNNNPDALPGDAHGTHVAGIAAADIDNGIGTAGTAGGATIMPLKWYDGGVWTAAIISETFAYAADNGAKIVNSSYNMDGWANDAVVHAAFDYMHNAGVLHFNSAGNSNRLNPARQVFEKTLLVASVTANDTKSGSSNYGTGIDLAAPGSNILSTTPNNNYSLNSGTSMAAPNAAGAAALIWSANPTWTREQVVAQLFATADDITPQNPTLVDLLGKGRVNSGRAVTETISAPTVKSITSIPASGMATLSDEISDFEISYSQLMDPMTVTDAASYELRDAGIDGLFDTSDDQVFALNVDAEYFYGSPSLHMDIADGPLGIGNYRFSVFSGGAANPFGTPLDGDGTGTGGGHFQAFFSIPMEAFVKTGLTGGLGSVSANNAGSLGGLSDTDSYEFFVEAGELVTAVIRPADAAVTLNAEFVELSGIITASAAGEDVLIPLTPVTSDGIVTLSVAGDGATPYTFEIFRNLNAAGFLELAGPVDLEDSFLEIGSGRYGAIAAANGSTASRQLIQTNDPSLFVDISATGTPLGLLDDAEVTIQTTIGNPAFPAGNVTIANNGGIIAENGEDLNSSNTALPNVSWETALLPFWDDFDDVAGDVFWEERQIGGIHALVVQWDQRARFSNLGDVTFQVQVFESGPVLARFAYQDVEFGYPQFDQGASATVGFQQSRLSAVQFSVDAAVLSAGDVIDLVLEAPSSDTDEFNVDVAVGSYLDVVLEGIASSFTEETIELIDPNGSVVATGSTMPLGMPGMNFDQAIVDYEVVTAGLHTVRITAAQSAVYSLIVTEDLVFDLESNNVIGPATRSLDHVHGAMGSLSGASLSYTQFYDPSAFVDISGTGVALGLGDDGEASITTTVGNDLFPAGAFTVANNGGLIVGANENLGTGNTTLPVSSWNTALLPFWDDIDSDSGNVYWEEVQINGIETLVVQWHDRPRFPNTGGATFQIQLPETGPVAARFVYQDVIFDDSRYDHGASATVGVQLSPTDALNVSVDVASIFDGDVIEILSTEDDIFAFDVEQNGNLIFETNTPFDQPNNLPSNELDPVIAILDGDGNVLASDANSAGDGKNAVLSFTANAAGTYYVVVSTEAGQGEYFLTIDSVAIIDGDFNDDGSYDCLDIDALTVEVATSTNAAAFDLTGDGLVDLADRDAWLAEAAVAGGFSSPYILGDINLDGANDGADFIIWNTNKFTDVAAYCSGDINMDGTVDGGDFIEWNTNKFQSSSADRMLPHPSEDKVADAVPAPEVMPPLNTLPMARRTQRLADSVFAAYPTRHTDDSPPDAANDADLFTRPESWLGALAKKKDSPANGGG